MQGIAKQGQAVLQIGFRQGQASGDGLPAGRQGFAELLLKALHVPALRGVLLAGAQTFLDTCTAELPAAGRADARRRALRLLPCLLLARVDGKSPVEYLDDNNRARIRQFASRFIEHPPAELPPLLRALEAASLLKEIWS